MSWSALLVVLVGSGAVCQAQQTMVQAGETFEQRLNSAYKLHWWNHWGYDKEVTHEFPTDYRVSGVYRLKTDLAVECGGTASSVTPYWIDLYTRGGVEGLKESLRDPEGAKE